MHRFDLRLAANRKAEKSKPGPFADLVNRVETLEAIINVHSNTVDQSILPGTNNPDLWGGIIGDGSSVSMPVVDCPCDSCNKYRKAHPESDPNKTDPKGSEINAPYREAQRRALRDRLLLVLSNLEVEIKALVGIKVNFSDQIGWVGKDRIQRQIEALNKIRHQTVQLLHSKGSIEHLDKKFWGDNDSHKSYPIYGCPCTKCELKRASG